MNKQTVKVILKVAEELWASKSSGYKKVQLGTKNPVSLRVNMSIIKVRIYIAQLFIDVITITAILATMFILGSTPAIRGFTAIYVG